MPRSLIALSLATMLAVIAATHASRASGAGEQSSGGTARTGPPGRQVLEDVTVTAQRAKLAQKVSTFVDQIAASDGQNAEGLPLWHAPVCPSVTGLTRQEGEYLLWRISSIARGAGVPIAGESCRPNLFIFVTGQPHRLLEAMAKRKRAVVFGNSTPPLTVKEFIAEAEPVKVWYASHRETPEYAAPSYNAQSTHPCPFADFAGAGATVLPHAICDSERSSRFTTTLVSVFSYVYVIVDERQLDGVTWQQLADYVGMVGLAKVNPIAHPSDVPTILKLFGAAHAAPPGITEWDRAFIESLYATQQSLKFQRRQIASRMVRQLEH